MRYDDPRLRDLLAGAYVMATLPRRARARFERLMAGDPALARLVAAWEERLTPLDATAAAVEPPPRLWHAIARETGAGPATATPRQERRRAAAWWDLLPLWRALALGALAAAAALALHIAVPRPLPATAPAIVAVLSDQSGAPSWLATAAPDGRVEIAAIRPQLIDGDRAFELWAIAGGPPRPLGLLRPAGGERLVLAAGTVPRDGVLAVSLEPAGGSPTGLPTGPVLYQGKILAP